MGGGWFRIKAARLSRRQQTTREQPHARCLLQLYCIYVVILSRRSRITQSVMETLGQCHIQVADGSDYICFDDTSKEGKAGWFCSYFCRRFLAWFAKQSYCKYFVFGRRKLDARSLCALPAMGTCEWWCWRLHSRGLCVVQLHQEGISSVECWIGRSSGFPLPCPARRCLAALTHANARTI